MIPLTPETIETLARLEREATAGPWEYDERVGCVAVYAGEHRNCIHDGVDMVHLVLGDPLDSGWYLDPQKCADAALIAAARNALPALLDAAQRLEQIQALRERIARAVECACGDDNHPWLPTRVEEVLRDMLALLDTPAENPT